MGDEEDRLELKGPVTRRSRWVGCGVGELEATGSDRLKKWRRGIWANGCDGHHRNAGNPRAAEEESRLVSGGEGEA